MSRRSFYRRQSVCVHIYLEGRFGGAMGVDWCACERGGWFWVKKAGGGDLLVIKYYIDNFRRACVRFRI